MVWIPNSRLGADMDRRGLLPMDGLIFNVVRGLSAGVSCGVARLLGVEEGLAINFGLSVVHLFFAGAVREVSVNIVS
ncbi:hypothetical protein G9A89_007611 [Geosiphon pyriformis]|nr:hypothetical protein G9A89_007611 [Geosiphon pyriformis]